MQRTVLNSVHRDLGARLVEFGGYEMPIQYRSIIEEHHAVRRAAGLFDLCHMGRFELRGDAAGRALERLVTCGVEDLKIGQVRYGLVTNEQGGVRDDVLVYRLVDRWWLVVNAGNRRKLLDYLPAELPRGVEFSDRSEELAMIALQGPAAAGMLAPHLQLEGVNGLAALKYYRIAPAQLSLGGERFAGSVSRTGYTGEDGFEFYVESAHAAALWSALSALPGDVTPCGLGARDTLRLEAGMPLYGHELSETTDPYSAGLSFAVRLDKPGGLVGEAALRAVRERGPSQRLRGFTVDGRRVAREGMPILQQGREVGRVTSGAPSPTLESNIAMAYVEAGIPDATPLTVEVRGQELPLVQHALPFYRRT